MAITALVNGEPSAQVPISDRGFQYGDGVFTTLRVCRSVPLFLDAHLSRLERDSARLRLPFPGREALIRETKLLCEERPEAVLKIQLTRGSGGRGYLPPESATGTRVLGSHPLPEYPPELQERGVEIRLCGIRLGINPSLAGLKHLNRLEQVLARAEWPPGDIREGLMLDAEGQVVEGTMSNLFLAKDGRLTTPRLDRCGVAGVMRGQVMAGLAQQGHPVEERRISLEDVRAADELFLTNSVIGLWPVRRFDGQDCPVGPFTQRARQWLTQAIQEQLANGCAA
jgi:4-amino-4-deoxychorismate lyase